MFSQQIPQMGEVAGRARPPRSRGYAPLEVSPEQDAALNAAVALAGPGQVVVLDLDGCLFDSRPRIIHLLRELAGREGFLELYAVQPQHFVDWDLRATLLRAGIGAERAAGLAVEGQAWFNDHFFRSDRVLHDHAMPGAPPFVWSLYTAGATLVYLTGRHEDMRPGTEQALANAGFPWNRPRVHLLMKPDVRTEDTHFKGEALREVCLLGQPCVFFDNEPANVNLFSSAHPEALVVFVETDHSPRLDQPAAGLPWVRGFLRQAERPGCLAP